MKLIGICLMAATLVMAQDKSRAADHSKASDASAGKAQDGASKDAAKTAAAKAGDKRHQKQQSDVKSPRDSATGQASGR